LKSRSDRSWLLALFAIALVLRLTHLWSVHDLALFRYLMLDPLMYDEWGLRLATSGDWLGQSPYFQDPLYAYLLGLVYAIAGHSYVVVVSIQLVLGALVAPLIVLASTPHIGRFGARAAGLIAALYLPSIFYEGLILKTAPATFMVALALWLLSRALQSGRRRDGFLLGLGVGLAALLRGNLILFVPLLALAFWWRLPAPRRAGWALPASLLLGALMVIAPVTVRNRIVGDAWILTTANAGQNFYIGNNPANTTGEYTKLPFVDANPKHEERGFAREAARRTGRELTPAATSRFWFAQGLAYVTAEPADWLALLWKKNRVFWGAFEVPDNFDYYFYRETASILRLPLPGFGLIAPLGLLGLLLAWRRGTWLRLLACYVLLYAVTVVAFFVFSRFRMVMMPALFVFAGIALSDLFSRFQRRERRQSGLLLIGLALAGLWVHVPIRAVEGSLTARFATALALPVRLENTSLAHFNLGRTYAARIEESPELFALAEKELRRTVEMIPNDPFPRTELGKLLAKRGEIQAAAQVYEGAVYLQPRNFILHYGLGRVRALLPDSAAAADSFREALRLNPRHAPSAVGLGEALLELGLFEQAEQAYSAALDLNPRSAEAMAGLARSRQQGE